jgi:hypothetical protein
MGGFFHEGIDDPREGFNRGKTEGVPIDFWVKIHITPLKEFFGNPEHAAAMEGKVSAGRLGERLVIRNGGFNMFPGEEGSGFRHITYRFGFSSKDNEPFWFSGIKNVHLAKKQRARHEPVTLYSRLYRGDSDDGELFGAGILTFNILKDGPGLASSIRVTGAKSFGEKLKALRYFATASG